MVIDMASKLIVVVLNLHVICAFDVLKNQIFYSINLCKWDGIGCRYDDYNLTQFFFSHTCLNMSLMSCMNISFEIVMHNLFFGFKFAPGLPKTRSGKIMRRILRKVAANKPDELGDTSTLFDPSVVDAIVEKHEEVYGKKQ